MILLIWMFFLSVMVIGIGTFRRVTKKKYGVFNTGIGMMMVVIVFFLLYTDPFFVPALAEIFK